MAVYILSQVAPILSDSLAGADERATGATRDRGNKGQARIAPGLMSTRHRDE